MLTKFGLCVMSARKAREDCEESCKGKAACEKSIQIIQAIKMGGGGWCLQSWDDNEWYGESKGTVGVEGLVVWWYNALTLQSEQYGGEGSIPDGAQLNRLSVMTRERLQTQLGLVFSTFATQAPRGGHLVLICTGVCLWGAVISPCLGAFSSF